MALAEQMGPSTFDQPTRSWAQEELDNIWLPSAAVASIHVAEAGQTLERSSLLPLGSEAKDAAIMLDAQAMATPKRYRMVT